MYTMGYDSTIKENAMMPFAAMQMNLESVTLSEVSQREKDTYM